jgi:hypothetical protein
MLQEHPAMRQPRVRFTVWRMMMAVGFSAALLTAFEAGRRYFYCIGYNLNSFFSRGKMLRER